jgi:hypothetical protein
MPFLKIIAEYIVLSVLFHSSAIAQANFDRTTLSIDWKYEESSYQVPIAVKDRLSILDFKIGQSFEDVDIILKQRPFQMVRRLKSADHALSVTTSDLGFTFKIIRPSFVSDVIANDLIEERSEAEGIRVFFTSPSNGRKVFSLLREVSYVSDPSNPTLDSMLAAAEQKWGPSPVNFQGYSNSKYLWFYDKNGVLIDSYLAEKRCRVNPHTLIEPLGASYQISGGYSASYESRFTVPCPFVVALDINHNRDRTIGSFKISIEAIPIFKESYDKDRSFAETELQQLVSQFKEISNQNRVPPPKL